MDLRRELLARQVSPRVPNSLRLVVLSVRPELLVARRALLPRELPLPVDLERSSAKKELSLRPALLVTIRLSAKSRLSELAKDSSSARSLVLELLVVPSVLSERRALSPREPLLLDLRLARPVEPRVSLLVRPLRQVQRPRPVEPLASARKELLPLAQPPRLSREPLDMVSVVKKLSSSHLLVTYTLLYLVFLCFSKKKPKNA